MNNKYFNKDFIENNLYNQEKYNIETNNTIEKLLKINKGKKINIYTFLENKTEKEFKGILENIEKEFINISEPSTGKWYIIPIRIIEYISFDENINYS